MLKFVQCLGHNSIKITDKNVVIYFDPFQIKDKQEKGDFIFITHNHYDHFSKEDILKLKKSDSKIIVTKDLVQDCLSLGFDEKDIFVVEPNNKYNIFGYEVDTIPAYNIDKKFHPKENDWVGYVITLGNAKYYVAGDTDRTKENEKVVADVVFLPVGGTYTMNSKEASELVKIINPKFAVPTHYGVLVGTKQDAEDFCENLKGIVDCEILY